MKKLCEPDKRNELFGITLDFLKQELEKVPVSDKVPGKLKAMIEVAKKICLYAYYEYDFYTLSLIYSSLLVETAIKERFLQELPDVCHLERKGEQKDVTKNYNVIYGNIIKGWRISGFEDIKSLGCILEWLRTHQILPDRINDKQIEGYVEVRNMSAHLNAHNINLPTMVIPILLRMYDFVNCLFDPGMHNKEPEIISEQLDLYRKFFEQFRKIGKKIRRHNDKIGQ